MILWIFDWNLLFNWLDHLLFTALTFWSNRDALLATKRLTNVIDHLHECVRLELVDADGVIVAAVEECQQVAQQRDEEDAEGKPQCGMVFAEDKTMVRQARRRNLVQTYRWTFRHETFPLPTLKSLTQTAMSSMSFFSHCEQAVGGCCGDFSTPIISSDIVSSDFREKSTDTKRRTIGMKFMKFKACWKIFTKFRLSLQVRGDLTVFGDFNFVAAALLLINKNFTSRQKFISTLINKL